MQYQTSSLQKNLLLLGLPLFISFLALAKPVDSTDRILEARITALNTRLSTVEQKLQTQIGTVDTHAVADICRVEKTTYGEGLLISSPILLFLLAGIYFLIRLKKNDFTLSDALSTYRPYTTATYAKSIASDGSQSVTEGKNTQDKQVRSVSRIIAFLTGMAALIIAICLTTYLGYQAITGCGRETNIDSLWKILLALGIGVIPYGANVISGNAKEGIVEKPPTTA